MDLAKFQAFKIIFTLQMAPVMFEVNSDAVNIGFNFSPPSSSAWDQMLINSHL